jgi:hypothetical protein
MAEASTTICRGKSKIEDAEQVRTHTYFVVMCDGGATNRLEPLELRKSSSSM